MSDTAPVPGQNSIAATPDADSEAVNRLALRLIAANARINAIALLIAISLIGLGAWAYTGIQQSLRDMRAVGLSAVLDADVQAVGLWIEDRKDEVRHWAVDSRIRAAIIELSRGAASEKARASLAAALAPALKESGAVAYNVVDRQGVIIASVAHDRGLIHRDIKPHNLMLCQRGGEFDVVKILDFGLVKDLTTLQSRNITQFQRVVGAPVYMAPERVRNAADADNRSDIYSVGATPFHLLAGRPPYEAAGEHDLTYQILHSPVPNIVDFVPQVPARLAEIITRCLAKDRGERPHDIVVILAALESLAVAHPWTQRDASAWWGQPSDARAAS